MKNWLKAIGTTLSVILGIAAFFTVTYYFPMAVVAVMSVAMVCVIGCLFTFLTRDLKRMFDERDRA